MTDEEIAATVFGGIMAVVLAGAGIVGLLEWYSDKRKWKGGGVITRTILYAMMASVGVITFGLALGCSFIADTIIGKAAWFIFVGGVGALVDVIIYGALIGDVRKGEKSDG